MNEMIPGVVYRWHNKHYNFSDFFNKTITSLKQNVSLCFNIRISLQCNSNLLQRDNVPVHKAAP